MVNIEYVKKGDILITEESQWHLFYGPVMIIDKERNEIGIIMGGETKSFPPEKLWTIPAFIKKNNGTHSSSRDEQRERILAGFIATIGNGDVAQNNIDDIIEEIYRKGIPPAKTQEVLEVVMTLKER